MREWLGDRCEYFAQSAGDLGERLTAASAVHFSRSAAPLIFIGGDCPSLTRECLQQLFTRFARCDAVLAPALDGGYCLIGLRARNDAVFRDIAWSTGAVLEQTRQRLRESGARWVETETLEDVDDLASWRRAVAAFPELGSVKISTDGR